MTTHTVTADAAPAARPVPSTLRPRTSPSCLRWGLGQRALAAAVAGAGLWTAVLWALGAPA